jgi:hypothetical protein
VDAGGRQELFEVKWTEIADLRDTVNLDFVHNLIGKSRVTADGVVSRTPNSFPILKWLSCVASYRAWIDQTRKFDGTIPVEST